MEISEAFSLPYSLAPWDNNARKIWLASTLTLHRNVSKFLFPARLEASQRLQLLTFLHSEILKQSTLRDPLALTGDQLKAVEKEFLLEHYLTSQPFNEAYVGDGFVVDTSGQFLATLNLGEHLKLQWTCIDDDLIQCLERLTSLESFLSRSVNFAFSSKFGFLNADPMRCGTGLLVTCFLHLPALEELELLNQTLDKHKESTLEFRGLSGKPDHFIGSIVAISNLCSLGWSEEKIVSHLQAVATRLIAAEKNARAQLQSSQAKETVDRICRAYGLLRYSYQLHTSEALGALSLMKLALDLGWLKGISHALLNQFLIQLRRAHLQFGHPHCKPAELTHLRATKLQNAFANVELTLEQS